MKKGLFITFEGNDGCGKTTQIELLKEFFEQHNEEVILTREPGGTIISEKIRDIILDVNNSEMVFDTEMLLYAAARAQHVNQIIKPALDSGQIVISDRFIDSSLVYQGLARGLGFDKVMEVNQTAIKGTMPDITFFIDIKPEVALQRRKSATETDRLENEKIFFHKKVYEGYKQIANVYKDRIITIDGTKTINEINSQIIKIINNRLSANV